MVLGISACAVQPPDSGGGSFREVYSLSEADATVTGSREGAVAGWSVAAPGDVDGDGVGDVLVGAIGERPRGSANAGTACVVRGPLSGVYGLAEEDGCIEGSYHDHRLGESVAGVGDVDSDGLADLMVGAPGAGNGAEGRVGLVHGPSASRIVLDEAAAVFAGASFYGAAGAAVAGAGDVDGDGGGDLIVGAPEAGADTSPGQGAVYLVSGLSSGEQALADGTALWTGGAPSDTLGVSVAGAGDVDGDGLRDLVFGAPGADLAAADAGVAYVVLGPVAGTAAAADADALLQGGASLVAAGGAVAGAGDINGDGLDDVLVGGRGDATAGPYAGSAWLFTGPVLGEQDMSSAAATLTGVAAADEAGSGVAGAGDVDGDGHQDVLVGAHSVSTGAALAGAVYLCFGPIAGSKVLSEADLTLLGVEAGDDVGNTFAAAGDVTGDGIPDLLLGAPGADTAYSAGGAALIVSTGGR